MPPADPAADDLYALPLEEFTAARNELAARVRKEGRRDEAEALKRLPKPSITAWALNQVARRDGDAVAALLDAGATLAKAQQALMAGRDRAAFRSATEAERGAIERLLQSTAGILENSGHPANKAVLDRLEATLRAAAADPEAGQLLRRGVLTEDLDPSGFGFGVFGEAAPAAIPLAARRRPTESDGQPEHQASPPDEAEEQQRVERVEQAREALNMLKQRLQALRDQAAEAERDAAASRQSAVKADRAVVAARDALSQAEHEAGIAHKAQAEAAQALQDLRSDIDRAVDDLTRAEEELRSARS